MKGTVRPSDITQVTGALDVAMKRNDHLSVVADLTDMHGMTIKALLRDVAEGMKRIGEVGRFERVAVIADDDWIATAATVENALLPGVTVRRFASADAAEARTWAAEA